MTSDAHPTPPPPRTLVQQAALLVGVVFVLVGALGFVPGITSDYGALEFAERDSEAMLFGVFQVSILHNIVHLLIGIAGMAMARSVAGARAFLIGGGIVYLGLWLYGLLIDLDTAANFVPLNTADNWLHFGLGVGMIALAVLPARRTAV